MNDGLVETLAEAAGEQVRRNILFLIFFCDKSDTQLVQLVVGLKPLIPVFEFIQIFFPCSGLL